MMNAVGGTTLHYWAQSWRLNPWDFKVVSETTLPAQGVAVDNWADDNYAGLDFIGAISGSSPTAQRRWHEHLRPSAPRRTPTARSGHLQKTTLPYEDNYLDLHPTVTDPLGDPVRITKDNAHMAAPGWVHPRIRRHPDG